MKISKKRNVLHKQIIKLIDLSICDQKTSHGYREKLEDGALTRDEDTASHVCVYFLPYNPKNKKVFIVHHKKSGLWISPGGHVDQDEGLMDTLNREIYEELGLKNFFNTPQLPFLLTITPIKSNIISCREHFDIWYLIKTDGTKFAVDPEEFYDTAWLSMKEAENIVTDPANKKALKVIKTKFLI